MLSQTVNTCVPDEGLLLLKLMELKWSNCHSCPPAGFAARFNETANLMVNMELILQRK